MTRPPSVLPDRPWNGLRVLDAFSCAGGAGMGYHLAGYDVTALDIAAQPHNPFPFVRADALDALADRAFLAGFDLIHASPPCQAYTLAQRIRGNPHPDLIEPVRTLLQASGLPYVIENVPGAPLRDPVTLCGAMFGGLRVYRHREFETSHPVPAPPHPAHAAPLRKMGRPPQPGDFVHVVGNFSGVAYARQAMGIAWMTRDELREAIPPAYTRHIGAALAALLTVGEVAA
ncbi:DNA (cytosine-5)-methyltransferase 1 [Actinomadura madurae]|uniref:DNA (Cytosine-5)-methyltransferase 1 n=1 Tax=Actinomadura madurae TaxID=1993 RepID=A0A1I5S7L1_9ACTN|nr:DNA cytosine methyltransferase [Actinomadura madurae]SFP66577.1 DNA (cytosine-5)-methyltransferase 1 [Actinomadura madurae]